MKTIGMLLIVIGLVGVGWGGFTYVKDRDTAHLGPVSVTVEQRDRVSIPPLAGVAALFVGGLLLFRSRHRGLVR
jgi:hypothetical protein